MSEIRNTTRSNGNGSVKRTNSNTNNVPGHKAGDKGSPGKEDVIARIRAANRKRRLIDVITEYGIKLQRNPYRSEWSHNIICPLKTHKGGNERTASFGYCYRDDHFHCFSGDTRVITSDGVYEIRDLVGKTRSVLGKRADWVDATFSSYGEQKLWKVHLSRNRQSKVVYTTSEHRWFVRSGKRRYDRREVLTKDLIAGHRLSYVFPRCHTKQMALSPFGIARGIVFGDGTSNDAGGFGYLHGTKDEQLRKWFPLNKITLDNSRDDRVIVHNLPRYFKTLPPLQEAAQYLYGWLAGYFAADGSVSKDGTVSLESASRENLEFVRSLCTRLGIGTYGITEHLREGFPGREKSSIFRVHFVNDHLTSEFFLIDQHRQRFESSKKKFARLGWTVQSVEETNRTEEVFCAQVEDGHAFALEDNILTGNCHGCGQSGRAVEFIWEFEGRTRSRTRIADEILSMYGDDVVPEDYEDDGPAIEAALFYFASFVRGYRKKNAGDKRLMERCDKVVGSLDSLLALRLSQKKLLVEELEYLTCRAKELILGRV